MFKQWERLFTHMFMFELVWFRSNQSFVICSFEKKAEYLSFSSSSLYTPVPQLSIFFSETVSSFASSLISRYINCFTSFYFPQTPL